MYKRCIARNGRSLEDQLGTVFIRDIKFDFYKLLQIWARVEILQEIKYSSVKLHNFMRKGNIQQ